MADKDCVSTLATEGEWMICGTHHRPIIACDFAAQLAQAKADLAAILETDAVNAWKVVSKRAIEAEARADRAEAEVERLNSVGCGCEADGVAAAGDAGYEEPVTCALHEEINGLLGDLEESRRLTREARDDSDNHKRVAADLLERFRESEALAKEQERVIKELKATPRYPKGSVVPEWNHYCADGHEPVASLGDRCPVCKRDAFGEKPAKGGQ